MTPFHDEARPLPSPIVHFEKLARRAPSRTSVVVDSFVYSRQQIFEAANALTAGLWAQGIRKGDRVAIIRRNAPLHMVALLAASRIGAILVPLNFRLSPSEFQVILDDADCAAVICGPRFAHLFDKELHLNPATLWVVDDIDPSVEPPDDETLSLRWHRLSELHRAGEGTLPDAADIATDTPALILYTSGSSGRPKGVTLTWGNLWWSWQSFAFTLNLTSREVSLAIAPFGHVGGLNTFTMSTLLGGGIVVVQRLWDVGQALKMIEKWGVTRMFGVPTMYSAMANHPDFARRNLSSLKTAIVGGSPCPKDLLETYRERSIPLVNSWGMTELAGGGTLTPAQEMTTRITSIGKPLKGMDIRIVNSEGLDVPEGTPGELWVRGPNVTGGYWGMDISQENGFHEGGWFATGDIVSSDSDGFLTIEGRKTDLIISGGENIFPAEIESVLHQHSEVDEAIVVGVPDNRWGEVPVAFVVTSSTTSTDSPEDIRLFVGNYLARYKIPRELWILDEIPRGATGKPDRKTLSARAAALHDPGPGWDIEADQAQAVES